MKKKPELLTKERINEIRKDGPSDTINVAARFFAFLSDNTQTLSDTTNLKHDDHKNKKTK